MKVSVDLTLTPLSDEYEHSIKTFIKKIRSLDYKYTKDLELYLKKELNKSGLKNIEYLEIRSSKNLVHPKQIINRGTLRVFIAVYVDNVRLIDNYKLN